jgi:hypothetical protein
MPSGSVRGAAHASTRCGGARSVVNLAVRRSAPRPDPGRGRAKQAVENLAALEPLGELTLKGIQRPAPAFNVAALRGAATRPA